MAHEDLCYQTVDELSSRIASREISPVELTRAYLERAEELNPRVNAVLTFLSEQAIARARTLESETSRGPLHGIPCGVKDLLDTAGTRTTWGSGIFAERVPDRDAEVVSKLDEAGAVLIAKLHMSEFAGGATRSRRFDHPHNPWKLDRVTSGSSSGSGAATAAAQVAFAIGSETGGSIISPSAACGITGLRPTYGRVSRKGAMPLAWSLDKLGPMARSAVDCGIVLEAIAERPFAFRREGGAMTGRRAAVVSYELELASEANRRIFEEAIEGLRRMGLATSDADLPDYPYREIYNVTSNGEAGTFFKPLFDDGRIAEMYSANRRADWMAASMMPASDYIRAQRIRAALTRDADALLGRVGLLVAATVPAGARPIAEEDAPPVPGTREGKLMRFANLAGLPGVSIPCGFDADGLPLALHIVGPAWEEQSILDVAMAFQRETDFHRRRPGLAV
ncbi:MAG: amidase [Vicinamibacteria bacterium]